MILNFGQGRGNMRKERNTIVMLIFLCSLISGRMSSGSTTIHSAFAQWACQNGRGTRRIENERERERRTVAIINEVVERVVITGVSELVVVGGQLLQALHSYRTEVPDESCVLCEYICAACHEAVNERLSLHRTPLRRKI